MHAAHTHACINTGSHTCNRTPAAEEEADENPHGEQLSENEDFENDGEVSERLGCQARRRIGLVRALRFVQR
jgi:hypothetical protein